MMNVAVDGHGGTDFSVFLHAADCYRHIVDHAKAFSVIGEGVVKAASDVEADAIPKRVFCSKNRTASGHPECSDQLRGVGNLHLHFFAWRERSGLQLVDVLRSMN